MKKAIALLCCAIVYFFASSGRVFGKFINNFFPCVQDIKSSFPCFAVYDLSLMFMSIIVGGVFLFALVLDLIKWLKLKHDSAAEKS